MKDSVRTAHKPGLVSRIFRYILAIIAIICLVAAFLWFPPGFSWAGPALVVFVAILSLFPLNILENEFNFIHILSLITGFLAGPSIAGAATVSGLIVGFATRRLWIDGTPRRVAHAQLLHMDLSLWIGLQVIPLVSALLLFGRSDSLIPMHPILGVLAAILTFTALHSAIYLLDYLLRRPAPKRPHRRSLLFLILLELGPLPLTLSLVLILAETGSWPLVPTGMMAVFVAVLIYEFSLSRVDLERRALELSSLNQVSQALRSTLSLENLLEVIQTQVSDLMSINNFYVALYDAREKRIWYPLAVKRGQRCQWQPRPIIPNRLTDRVIQKGQPVSLSSSRENDLDQAGLPPSEETPLAWMGVPLITADRTIGCLAIFTVLPGADFTLADLNLLTTLSGQVSVAIENALLYEQARRRNEQLEILNRIGALITASLNQEEVLALVCRSVAQVSAQTTTGFGGTSSAIFLLDAEKGIVILAQAYRLSENFTRANWSFPVTNHGRMRCLRSGRAVLSTDLTLTPLDLDYLESLRNEKIQSYAEFPLTTPSGQLGFLAVYYDTPHVFQAEELELISTFVSQAAIAVSNARLYANVDTALSRRVHQLSILESIGRELSAAIHSDRLFELILDHAMNFTNSRWGELSLMNPANQLLEVKAARGYSVSRIHFPPQDGLAGQAASNKQIINLGDVRTEPAYRDMTNGEARSQLCIPLMHEEGVHGVLSLESDQFNAYTENDQNFISQLATQAAIAVVNAQLYNQTQRRLRELSVLYLVSTNLVTNPDIQSVMQTVARSMEAALQTSSVGIYLWDPNESSYVSNYSIQSPSRPDCILPGKIPNTNLEDYQPKLVKTGPLRIAQRPGQELLGDCRDCQALIFPLVASKQRLGLVLMHIPPQRLVQDEDLQLMRAVVAQVSISLQNALLFADVSHGRDQMAAVLNSVGEGILMIERSGNIVLANEFIQTITGLPRDGLVGCWFPHLPEGALRGLGYTQAEAQELLQDLAQGQVPQTPKTTLKNGERVLERQTSSVWGQGARLIGWMVVLHDVTEEYDVAQARELITGTLVHDLRSPVGSVISALAIINEILPQEQRDDVIDQALRVAERGAARVLGMIETLLDISRMRSGRIDLVINKFNLHALVASILVEFVPQANEFGIILRNEVPENLPNMRADQSKITRVVANLLDNALKFTPSGGQVQITAELSSEGGKTSEFIVKVSDTGPGVPEEYRERIFERFSQVPGAGGRRRGSGLGLTFCRMAVEAHGGRIWVENRLAPETGSIFTFSLPANITSYSY